VTMHVEVGGAHLHLASDEELAAELLTRIFGQADVKHVEDTPRRFVKSLKEMSELHSEPFDMTTFDSDVDEMVVMTHIPFYSLCAHHVLPFFGVCHIAYIPNGKICGLSKLPRCVQNWSLGLNVQEELTDNIANYLNAELDPVGLGVVMEAQHLCMTMRGVQTHDAITHTSTMLGALLDHSKQARSEFFQLIDRRSR
jgi:GTP cyclohydrolase I